MLPGYELQKGNCGTDILFDLDLGHSNKMHSFWSRIIQKSHASGQHNFFKFKSNYLIGTLHFHKSYPTCKKVVCLIQ